VTAYSIYSQPLSISGGHIFQPQPKVAPCPGDRDLEDLWMSLTDEFKSM